MPQLSPVSWFLVFVFLVGMMVNMSVIKWWNGGDDYSVGRVVVSKKSSPRLFFWGNYKQKVLAK
uniref:ATP synthase F0 subunit 8 n=1 Tax=Lanceolaria lanceolata TaxID=2508263 RepID=A0A1W5I7W2_LANLA|nr:ATP synthase F0 subunit 8 [Lanceolaria lanceolata]